jgi:hypothetical protein
MVGGFSNLRRSFIDTMHDSIVQSDRSALRMIITYVGSFLIVAVLSHIPVSMRD